MKIDLIKRIRSTILLLPKTNCYENKSTHYDENELFLKRFTKN